ncbi:hypothetical protein BDZ45DRAFT_640883 [Acephala macrosclerotiorum]|nr:hypothetical protein BDZ45DRAFT_640883 [Acephala macrosclerotiorum]
MPLPKLSPLQSRLAASLIVSAMLVILYFAISWPHFAYAAEVDSIRPEDHNHERLLETPFLDLDYEDLDLRGLSYEAEFIGFDRGIIGRATTDPTALTNNVAVTTNVPQGQVMSYMFTNASLWADKSPETPGLPSPILLDRRGAVTSDEDLVQDEEDDEEEEDGDGDEQDSGLRLQPRQSTTNQRTLYITVTTCTQPSSNATTDPPPQLQLYVSQSKNNTNPGPGQNSELQEMMELEQGYALYELNATGDVFMGIYAKNDSTYIGTYNAQIAASIDKPYHYYWNSSDPNLFVADSDANSALLFTDPLIANSSNTTLYEEWMDITPPFQIFASDSGSNSIMGLQNSYCGLQTNAQIVANRTGQTTSQIVTGMTDIGVGTLPKQQFYVTGLSAGTTYNVALAMNGNSTASGDGVVGGGGQVFHMTTFDTLQSDNCAVIFGLSFCNQVAYAVPTNPNTFPNMSSLAAYYDNATAYNYGIFKKVLAQIPCDTTSSAQYSLARNCTSCDAAYKQWLCSVNMPRCTDFTSTFSWLQPRAQGQPFPNGTFLDPATLKYVNNSAALNGSRNASIDTNVVPGPYKEVLPCEDLCYNLVQSCPASMGFSCPQPGNIGFNESYGLRPITGADVNGRFANHTCNFPGLVYFKSAGSLALPSQIVVVATFVALGLTFI